MQMAVTHASVITPLMITGVTSTTTTTSRALTDVTTVPVLQLAANTSAGATSTSSTSYATASRRTSLERCCGSRSSLGHSARSHSLHRCLLLTVHNHLGVNTSLHLQIAPVFCLRLGVHIGRIGMLRNFFPTYWGLFPQRW